MIDVDAPISDYMTIMPFTIGTDQSLEVAKEKMVEHECHHLPVLSGGRLVGVISERDILLAQSIERGDPANLKVASAMISDPITFDIKDSLRTVASQMYQNRVGSALILSENKLAGIFTAVDALKALQANG